MHDWNDIYRSNSSSYYKGFRKSIVKGGLNMEKEELKRIIIEVMEGFFSQHQEEWERYLHEWGRSWSKERLPPPPYWYPPISKDVDKLRQTVSSLDEISKRSTECFLKLESWAPACSEKKKIEVIETSVKNIENCLKDIERISSKFSGGQSK
jgi:hypothetical protein